MCTPATQTALAASELVACAKVVAPTVWRKLIFVTEVDTEEFL